MKTILIDLGCHDGESTRHIGVGLMAAGHEVEAYAIDPNPKFVQRFREINLQFPFTFINKAAWVKNGEIEMRMDITEKAYGSTLIKEKSLGEAELVTVQCFNFSEWLRNISMENPGVEIFLKMDVEGAEFKLIDDMLRQGTINIPSSFYIEWHDRKMPPEWAEERAALEKRMAEAGVKWEFLQ